MVEIEIHYHGELHCEAKHLPSASALHTDAPVDNQGKGESFSPTDLVATALGTCMVTTMGIVARRNSWNIDGMSLRVQKHMTSEPPRRIARLVVAFTIPRVVSAALTTDAQAKLEQTARTCPVALSLHPDVRVELSMPW